MKIDAHQHFWHYRKHEYPWIGPGMDALSRDYLPAEFERLMRSAGFGGSIAVQARQVPEAGLISQRLLQSLRHGDRSGLEDMEECGPDAIP
jgi:predicted TIM-barrel fold metal-dependent hydrolase